MTDAEGGDPVCWLDRVCPGCGRLVGDEAATCPSCGERIEEEAAWQPDQS